MKSKGFLRILGVLTVIAMIVAPLSACATPSANTATSAPAGTVAPSAAAASAAATTEPAFDSMAKYDPPITLNIAQRQLAQVKENPKMVWDDLFKQYGININYVWTADPTEYDNKLTLSIAAGDVPDLAQCNGQNYAIYLKNGLAMDLTDAWSKYATDYIKKLFEDANGYGINLGKVDGKIMSIPALDPVLNEPQLLWIRQDWLTKLKLQAPKTIADMKNVMDAFVNQDPDGDDKKDTIGMAIAGKDNFLQDWSGLIGFFGGFGAYPGRLFGGVYTFVKQGDKTVWGGETTGMKDALQTLSDWYKAGYLAKDFATWDGQKVADTIIANKCGMVYEQWWGPYYPLQDSEKKNAGAIWIPLNTPTPDGSPATTVANYPVSFYFPVGKNCKNPEAVIKIMNLEAQITWDPSVDNATYLTYYPTDGSAVEPLPFSVTYPDQPKDTYMHVQDALANKDNSKLNNNEKSIYDTILAYQANPDMTNDKVNGGLPDLQIFGDPVNSYYKISSDMQANGNLIKNMYFFSKTDLMSSKMPTLTKMQDETMMQIIYGAAPVSDYDKFLAQWHSLGGDDILKEVTDWVAKNPS